MDAVSTQGALQLETKTTNTAVNTGTNPILQEPPRKYIYKYIPAEKGLVPQNVIILRETILSARYTGAEVVRDAGPYSDPAVICNVTNSQLARAVARDMSANKYQ